VILRRFRIGRHRPGGTSSACNGPSASPRAHGFMHPSIDRAHCPAYTTKALPERAPRGPEYGFGHGLKQPFRRNRNGYGLNIRY
jgi:hypothetical protein